MSSRSHGMTGTRTYEIWAGIKKRCQNPASHAYARYGGRGIKVCGRWQTFDNFYADMGTAPVGMEIERKDNDGDYTPTNCRWATLMEQANNKGNNRMVEHEGRTVTIAEYSRLTGVAYWTVYHRLVRTAVSAVPHRREMDDTAPGDLS